MGATVREAQVTAVFPSVTYLQYRLVTVSRWFQMAQRYVVDWWAQPAFIVPHIRDAYRTNTPSALIPKETNEHRYREHARTGTPMSCRRLDAIEKKMLTKEHIENLGQKRDRFLRY